MKQAVITCTSGTRPSSPVQGMTIYETDTNLKATYDGFNWIYDGGWQNYTPTLTNITQGNGVIAGRYSRVGNTVIGWVRFSAGTTTVFAAGTLSVSLPLPVTAAATSGDTIGSGSINNGSGTNRRLISVAPTGASVSTVNLYYEGGTVTNTAPFTFGTTSQILFDFQYEKA
jgi:hypothetical protein